MRISCVCYKSWTIKLPCKKLSWRNYAYMLWVLFFKMEVHKLSCKKLSWRNYHVRSCQQEVMKSDCRSLPALTREPCGCMPASCIRRYRVQCLAVGSEQGSKNWCWYYIRSMQFLAKAVRYVGGGPWTGDFVPWYIGRATVEAVCLPAAKEPLLMDPDSIADPLLYLCVRNFPENTTQDSLKELLISKSVEGFEHVSTIHFLSLRFNIWFILQVRVSLSLSFIQVDIIKKNKQKPYAAIKFRDAESAYRAVKLVNKEDQNGLFSV